MSYNKNMDNIKAETESSLDLTPKRKNSKLRTFTVVLLAGFLWPFLAYSLGFIIGDSLSSSSFDYFRLIQGIISYSLIGLVIAPITTIMVFILSKMFTNGRNIAIIISFLSVFSLLFFAWANRACEGLSCSGAGVAMIFLLFVSSIIPLSLSYISESKSTFTNKNYWVSGVIITLIIILTSIFSKR